jgi:hypothetical protein
MRNGQASSAKVERRKAAQVQPKLLYLDSSIPSDINEDYAVRPFQRKLDR